MNKSTIKILLLISFLGFFPLGCEEEIRNYQDVVFSHENHLEREIDCKNCHKGKIDEKKTLLPRMEDCIACHSKTGEKLECSKCHQSIRKDEPPVSHTGQWKTEHGKAITIGDNYREDNRCNVCHSQASCDACHKDEKPQDHTNQWRLRGHQVMARIDRDRCVACHRQDFCVRCHSEAPAVPDDSSHRPGRSCMLCHVRLQHSVTDETGCVRCHED